MKIQNSFLMAPGVGKKREEKLWKSGITHWDHLEDSSALGDKTREKVERFLEKARKNLEVENSVFFHDKLPNNAEWRMYRNFQESANFFDIETTGLKPETSKVTTVSFYRGGESKTLVRGEDLTRERLEQEFFDSSILVSFNGKRFDQPFLEEEFGLNIENPHIDLMYLFKKLGLSGGLKQIEKDLGVERELEDVDGREAIRLWKQYEKHGDEEALQKLVRYNRYDARNLQDLLEIGHNRLTERVFQPHRDQG